MVGGHKAVSSVGKVTSPKKLEKGEPDKEVLRIVGASDNAYFPGLCLTFASTVAFLRKSICPLVSVIHDGLNAIHAMVLEKLLSRFHSSAKIDLNRADSFRITLPDAPGLHQLAYARLFAPEIVEEEKSIYLDSDLLVLRDISELAGFLDSEFITAAPICGVLGDDCPWLDSAKMTPQDPCFCSGVMAVNRNLWQRQGLTNSSTSLAKKDPAICKVTIKLF